MDSFIADTWGFPLQPDRQTVQFKKNRTAGLSQVNYCLKDPLKQIILYSLHLSVFLRVHRIYYLGLVNNEFVRLSNKIERFRSRIMLHLFNYRTHKEFCDRFYSDWPVHQSNLMERLSSMISIGIVVRIVQLLARYVRPLVRRIQVIEKSIISQVLRQTLAGFLIPSIELYSRYQCSGFRIPPAKISRI